MNDLEKQKNNLVTALVETIDSLIKMIVDMKEEAQYLSSVKDVVSGEIKELQSIKESIPNLKAQKEEAEKELVAVSSILLEKKDELRKEEEQAKLRLQALLKEEEDTIIRISEYKQAHDAENEALKQRAIFVAKEEKRLNKKDKDLAVLERRFKDMYGKHGLIVKL